MPPLWRLTRNRYGRGAYERLRRAGITATRMYEYVADLGGDLRERDPDGAIDIGERDPATLDPDSIHAHGDLRPDETVIVAAEDGEIVGSVFLSSGRQRVEPLEAEIDFEGAYVRRLFVDPTARNRGIATALVARACRLARERGHDRAVALVALDNRPSQWVFEANGFERRRVRSYVRVFGFRRRADRPIE